MIDTPRKSCFPPVVNSGTHILILGSLPGDASLTLQQYYGHRQNKFWELIGAVINVDLRPLPYDDRLQRLLEQGVGLWDVIAEADRKGSLDSAIRNEAINQLTALIASLPELKVIAFNGGTAAKIGRRQLSHLTHQYTLLDLPSSSPAYTLAYPAKLAGWMTLRSS
ncbi:DNA-deoxyinosine glycosylase [Burkholderiaceae bacterium DAT-1]|nr:DNA-deoxyinosine glycosylase [Burkholderiaceae bacterium DAT-1]